MQLKQKRKLKKRQIKAITILEISNYKPELLKINQDYVMQPSPQKIFAQNMITNGLKIKCRNTLIQWQGIINLANLRVPLSQTIWLGDNFVQAYKQEAFKPKVGDELNRPCVATFYSKKQLKYKTLEKICKKNGTNLIMFDKEKSIFAVRIPHFTKYQFELKDQQSEQEKEQARQTIKKGRTSHLPSQSNMYDQDTNKMIALDLISKIFQRGAQNILSNKNIVYQSSQIPQANGTLLYQIDSSNSRNAQLAQIFSYQLGFCANGKPLKLVRRKKQFEIIQIPMKKSKSQPFFLEQFLKKINQKRIDQFIVGQYCSLKMKRILSLLRICFYYPDIDFTFQPNNPIGKNINFRGSKPHPQNECQKVFNDWIQWTIFQNGIKLPKNQIYQKLAIRQPGALVHNLIRAEKFDDAQFLSCIEDQFYRLDTSQRKLIPQLQTILMQLDNFNESFHWIIQLGIQSWYFIKKTDFFDMLRSILVKNLDKVENYHQEFRILQSYYYANKYQKFNKVIFDKQELNLEDLAINWYITIELQKHEKNLFPSEKHYRKYRLRLLRSLLQKVMKLDTMLQILKLDKYLEEDTKYNILKDVLVNRKYKNDLLIDEELEHITKQSHAIFLLSQGRTLEALQKLKNCLPTTKIITKQYFLELCSKPQFLFCFKNELLTNFYHFIDNIIDQYPELKPVYTFLSIRLGIRSPNENNLTQLLNLIQPMEDCHVRTATSLLFKVIERNTLSNQWLKNQSLCNRLAKLMSQNKKNVQKLQKMKTIARL